MKISISKKMRLNTSRWKGKQSSLLPENERLLPLIINVVQAYILPIYSWKNNDFSLRHVIGLFLAKSSIVEKHCFYLHTIKSASVEQIGGSTNHHFHCTGLCRFAFHCPANDKRKSKTVSIYVSNTRNTFLSMNLLKAKVRWLLNI